jgi:Zn finger protein HypA/HybF involved in hydrogenase expression
MKIMSDTELCPACGSDHFERVRRSGREDWVFDRVYVCSACLQRSGRVPSGKTTLIARIMLLLSLI